MQNLENVGKAKAIIEQMNYYAGQLKNKGKEWTSLTVELNERGVSGTTKLLLCNANVGRDEMAAIQEGYWALIQSRLDALNQQLELL